MGKKWEREMNVAVRRVFRVACVLNKINCDNSSASFLDLNTLWSGLVRELLVLSCLPIAV